MNSIATIRRLNLTRASLLSPVLCLLAFGVAHAQYTWNAAVDDNWSAAARWDIGGPPGSGMSTYDIANFTDLIGMSGTRAITVDGIYYLNQINLTAGLGQTLLLTDAGAAGRGFHIGGLAADISISSNARLTFNTDVVLDTAASLSLHHSNAVMAFNAGKIFNIGASNLLVTGVNGSSAIIGATLTGTGDITKTGGGSLELSGNNTAFTGDVHHQGGVLRFGSNNALGGAAGGTLYLGDGIMPNDAVTISFTNEFPTVSLVNAFVWNNNINFENNDFTRKYFTFDYNGTVMLNNGIREVYIANLVEVSFGANLKLDGTGGLQINGSLEGAARFLNGNNSFTGGYVQLLKYVTVGAGAGSITLGDTAAGQNYLGIGAISVAGQESTLYLNPGAANFTNIKGRILVDRDSVLDILNGTTVLDGAILERGPSAGPLNRFIFRGNTNFIDASFINSPDLWFGGTTSIINLAITGAGMGAGVGNFVIDNASVTLAPSAANINASQFRIERGSLILGADNQVSSGMLFLGGATAGYVTSSTLNLAGFSGSFSGLAWSNPNTSNTRWINFGATGNGTLDFGAGSTGGASGRVYMQNWRDGATRLYFANDISGLSWSSLLAFDGFDWNQGIQTTATLGKFEVFPKLGATASPTTFEWTGSAQTFSGMTTSNNWNAPGNWNLNRVPVFGPGSTLVIGNKYGSITPSLNLANATTGIPGGVLTTGTILFNKTTLNYAATISSGTIIMDSGIPGVNALIARSYYDNSSATGISSVIQLDSNLTLDRTDANTPSGSYYRGFSGIIRDGVSGTSINVNQGAWYLSNTGNTFTGGITLNSGLLWLASSGTFNALGKGALTINGGVLQGYSIYNSATFAGSFAISSPGSAGYTHFYSTNPTANNPGDIIWINSGVTITGTMSTTYGWGGWAGLQFHEGRSIQGTGALTIAGVWDSLYTYAADSTFSGGFNYNSSSVMYVQGDSSSVGNGSLVFGTTSPGANYLGTGDITMSNGTIYAYGTTTGTAAFLNGATTTLTNGYFYVYSAPTLFTDNSSLRMTNGSFMASNGVTLSDMNLSGYGSVGSGGALQVSGGNLIVGNVNVSSYPNITLTGVVNVLAESGGTSLTGLGVLSKNTALTTSRIDTSITQLGASRYTINAGRLQFTRDDQSLSSGNMYLYNSAILNSAGAKNNFGYLYMYGNATLELGTGGELGFSSIGSWAASGVIPLLNIQNVTGAWNTAASLTLGSEHVWFTNNPFSSNDPRLAAIAFTGYTRGGTIAYNSAVSKYELIPSGEKGFEWSGASGAGNYWMTGPNWYGDVSPDGSGDIAIFRDADPGLQGKTIQVDGNRVAGKIYFEATSGVPFTIATTAGSTLEFANSGSAALLYFAGFSAPNISANMLLTDSLWIDHRSGNTNNGTYLNLSGTISGAGGINFTVDPASLSSNYWWKLSGSNTFTGGVRQQYGTLMIGNNNALGTGTYTITTQANLYLDNNSYTLRNPLLLDGNLVLNSANYYTLTFAGNTGSITAGMKDININSNMQALTFDADYVLTGTGGLRLNTWNNLGTYGWLTMRGQNTFTGGVTLNAGKIRVGASSIVSGGQVVSGPVGTGTFSIGNGYVFTENVSSSYTIHNPLTMGGGSTVYMGYYPLGGFNTAGSLIFDSVEDFKLNGGTNTFYLGGVVVDFKNSITNAANGSSASITLNYFTNANPFLRLSGSNSFTGGVTINANTTSSQYQPTLSLANDYALGTGRLTLNNYQLTLETFGPNRAINNLITFNNGNGYPTYFTATNGATSLLLSGSGNSTLGGAYYYWDIAPGLTVTFGADHNLISTTSTLTKYGAGTLEFLGGKSNFNAFIVNDGTATTTVQPGRDMTLGGVSAAGSAEDSYFGTGTTFTISGANSTMRINTWADPITGDTGDVYLKTSPSITSGGKLQITGGGNLRLNSTLTLNASGGVAGQQITIADGGWLIKDGTGASTLNTRILAPLAIQSGILSLTSGYSLSDATKLDTSGGQLNLNGLSQTLGGNWSLTGDFTIDLGASVGTKTLTVESLDYWDGDSELTIYNWNGSLGTGGAAQIIINNYNPALIGYTYYVPNVTFAGWASGARLQDIGGNKKELVPIDLAYEWTGSTSADWGIFTNWAGNSQANTPGGDATFGDKAAFSSSGTNIDVTGAKNIGSLTFNGTRGQTFHIYSNNESPLIFSALETLANDPYYTGKITLAGNSKAIISTAMELHMDLRISNSPGADLTLDGKIYEVAGDPRSVTKVGGGTLTILNNDSSFTGGFILSRGILRIGADEVLATAGYVSEGPLGTGDFVANSGTLEAYLANRTISNRVILRGGLGLVGGNTLTLAYDPTAAGGAPVYSQLTTESVFDISSGATLVVTETNRFIVNLDPGETGAHIIKAGAGRMILNSTLDAADGHVYGLQVNQGALILTASNSYTGTTTFRGGLLVAAFADDSIASLGDSHAIAFAANSGTLRFDNPISALTQRIFIGDNAAGTIINTDATPVIVTATEAGIIDGGFAYISSNGTLTLQGNYSILDNTASNRGGAIYSNNGFTLNLAAGNTFEATGNIASGGDASAGGFIYSATGPVIFNIGSDAAATIGDASSLATGADSIVTKGTGGHFVKSGNGYLATYGANDIGGATMVQAGILDILGSQSDHGALITGGTTTLYPDTWRSDGNFTITGGLLHIIETSTVVATGSYTQGANGTLFLDMQAGRDTPYVQADAGASLAGTLVVNNFATIAAYVETGSASGIDPQQSILLRAVTGTITGDFNAIDLPGFNASGLPDYIGFTGGVSEDKHDYGLGYGLSWYASGTYGHGRFTLAAGQTFDVDVSLLSRGYYLPSLGYNWYVDTLVLTPDNAGRLILSASNNFGGIDAYSGTLSITGYTNFNSSAYIGAGYDGYYESWDWDGSQWVSDYRETGTLGNGVVAASITGTVNSPWGYFYVGGSGTGALSITGDGRINSYGALIGEGGVFESNTVEWDGSRKYEERRYSVGSGSVSLSGNAVWSSTYLVVGNDGDGVLDISGNARVSLGYGLYIASGNAANAERLYYDNSAGNQYYESWRSPGISTGTVTIRDNGTIETGASWGEMHVGQTGHGALIATDNARIYSGHSYLGSNGAYLYEQVSDGGLSGDRDSGDASYGYASLSGSAWWDARGYFYLGGGGTGVLDISQSGSVTVGNSFYIGAYNAYTNYHTDSSSLYSYYSEQSAGSGTATVSDNALLRIGDGLHVGSGGHGVLNIAGQGTVITSTSGHYDTSIGAQQGYEYHHAEADGLALSDISQGASGIVTVSGSAMLVNGAGMNIGEGGRGELHISQSGSVTTGAYSSYSTWVYIGNNGGYENHNIGSDGSTHDDIARGALGIVTVSDDALFEINSELHVASGGTGALTISDNGRVTVREYASIGSEAGYERFDGYGSGESYSEIRQAASGSVTVSDNALFEINRELHVASGGTGVLDISGNARVTVGESTYLGESIWSNYHEYNANGDEYDQANHGSGGTITVRDAAFFQAGRDLYVGAYGHGAISILGSGSIKIGGLASIGGWQQAHTGTTNYNDDGWGAYNNEGASGIVTVGNSGLLQITDDLYIGESGQGALLVSDNATVTIGGNAWLGLNAGYRETYKYNYPSASYGYIGEYVYEAGSGTISVNGSGVLETGGTLTLGTQGTGVMNISGNGRVSSQGGVLGVEAAPPDGGYVSGLYSSTSFDYTAGTGMVSIRDSGLWTISGSLQNGRDGVGAINIRDSGSIAAAGAYAQGANATLSLDLDTAVRGHDDAFITAASATLSGTLIVDGYTASATGTKASELPSFAQLLIRTTGGVTDNLAGKLIAGGPLTADYLAHGAYVRSGTDYVLDTTLAWFSDTTASHGTFTLDAGKTFEVDVSLSSTTVHAGWDGASLTKKGQGTLILSATNTYTGTTVVETGTLKLITAAASSTTAIGAGALAIAPDATVLVAPGAVAGYTFANALTGAGLLDIDLGSPAPAFNFNYAATGSNFAGIVRLSNATYAIAPGSGNALALSHATLATTDGAILNLGQNTASGTMSVHALAFDGGLVNVQMRDATAAHVLQTGSLIHLDYSNAHNTTFNLHTDSIASGTDVTGNFLDQDNANDGILLVSATVVQYPGIQMQLLLDGATLTSVDKVVGDQHGHNDVVATYGYVAVSETNASLAQGPGVYASYLLTQLQSNSGLVISSSGATDQTLGARITGAGFVEFMAGNGSITLANATNDYTGATFITTGTVIAAMDNVLGATGTLNITATAAFDLNGRTQTIGSGSIAGALHSAATGSLGLNGLVDITSANPAFAASVGVAGTTTIHNTQALGNTGTVAIGAGASLATHAATGTLFKTLAGDGQFSLASASAVTLAADNTAYAGVFAIAAASRLIATTDANLGAANLSGAGVFEKQNAATTITIAHANTAYTGTTIITAGTLSLQNLSGVGSSDIHNNDALVLAASGTLANNITGSGTTFVDAPGTTPITLAGVNQTDWVIASAAKVSSTANLGSGATHIDGALIIAATASTPWLYNNPLTGGGALSVDTNGADFSFGPAAIRPSDLFRGTLVLANAAFHLSGANTDTIAAATLQLDAASHTIVGTGTQTIDGLTLNGGRIDFDTSAPADITSTSFVATGTLTLNTGTVGVNRPALDAIDTAIPQLPLLQQDEGNTGIQLASADTVTGNAAALKLADAATGEVISDIASANINQNGVTVATGTYDYGLTTGTANDGLYATYRLTAIDLLEGMITVLASDTTNPAAADNMTAKITGSGNLQIDATQSITLANADNAYTGTTLVTSGTLIAGSDNALGHTSALALEADTAFILGANTQTIGAIATASTSTLDLDAGILTIQSGGTIAGAIAGSATATLNLGGLVDITTSNPGLAASVGVTGTTIIHDVAAIGNTGAVAVSGNAELLLRSASGTLGKTLEGQGHLVVADSTVTITNANHGFTGSAAITRSHLTATDEYALGSASVTVSSGATFEQLNITGTLRNTLAGDGTHLVTNSLLVLPDAAGYAIASTTLDQPSAIILADSGTFRFGTLRMNGATLAFDPALAPRATASIATLGATSGTFIMNVRLDAIHTGLNPAGTVANYLHIGASETGTHAILINPIGLPAAHNTSIEIIGVDNPSATGFTMTNTPDGKLEYDMIAFELLRGGDSPYTPETNKWYLTDSGLSHAADAIIQTAASLALDWASALDSLHLRMGDVRAEHLASPGNPKSETSNPKSGDLWARTRGYRLNASGAVTGLPYRQYGWGLTAGADKSFLTEKGASLLGGFLDVGTVSRSFDNNGDGKTRTVGVGAYLTLLREKGCFADLIARFDRYSNDFNARAGDGSITRGKYTTKSLGLSAEAGRRIQRADSWWVEPALQASVLWLDGASYDALATATRNTIEVTQDSSTTYQYRALVRFGRQLFDSKWHPYGKIAAVSVESSSGAIHSRGKSLDATYDGKRIEFGFGTMYRINDISQAYLDYEYAKAANYERPWSLNLGYRRLW